MESPEGLELENNLVVPPTYDAAFHGPEVLQTIPYRQLGQTDMIVSKLSLGGTVLGKILKLNKGGPKPKGCGSRCFLVIKGSAQKVDLRAMEVLVM